MKKVKVKVAFEEHLCKVVEVEDPELAVKVKDSDEIIEKAIEMYNKGEVVLTADDFNGVRLISIRDDDNDLKTEWEEF